MKLVFSYPYVIVDISKRKLSVISLQELLKTKTTFLQILIYDYVKILIRLNK